MYLTLSCMDYDCGNKQGNYTAVQVVIHTDEKP